METIWVVVGGVVLALGNMLVAAVAAWAFVAEFSPWRVGLLMTAAELWLWFLAMLAEDDGDGRR